MVRRSKLLPSPAPFKGERLERLQAKLLDAFTRAREVEEMRRSEEAEERWVAAYPELSADLPGMVGGLAARSEAHALRFSMLYALLDGSQVIELPHLDAALALWDYANRSAIHVWGHATGNPEADAIARALQRSQRLTRTQINDLFGGRVRATELSMALDLLLRLGLARTWSEPTGGRPKEWWEWIG